MYKLFMRIKMAAVVAVVATCAAFSQTGKNGLFSGVTAKPYLMSYTHMRTGVTGVHRRDTLFFKQEKVIFGVNVKLNEYWSAQVGVDLINMRTPYLKPAMINYAKNRWKVDIGIFYLSHLEESLIRFWNNRFIWQVAADKWMHDPTADLGVRATYRWNDYLTTDVSIFSGTGYQHLTDEFHPMPTFRFILSPVKMLKLGGYASVQKNENITRHSFSGFVHLQPDNTWKLTGEYHYKNNYNYAQGRQLYVQDMRLHVASVYATYNFTSWWSMVGRYDVIRSEINGKSGNRPEDGQAWLTGWIFRCTPSLRLSVDYCNKRPSLASIGKEDWLYVCMEFKY
ncbi:MAG: porin [Bacteroidales bacterium]|jgi:hypothetical protein|nr:porin [Bacteroidales bacterium]